MAVDDYLQLVTDEAETISQLIAGYIDILLKKRKEGAALVDIGDDEQARIESLGGARALASRGRGKLLQCKASRHLL